MGRAIPIGIDLGTTYSAIARMGDSGQSVVIPNGRGELLTPSVVLFEDDRVLVGKEAKKMGIYDGDRLAVCAKRDIGRPTYTKSIKGYDFPPEVIQSYILKKLRDDLHEVVGPDISAVITVPAFFDEPRRKATADAASVAGLHMLDIVNEPTAAALAFGEDLGYLTPGGAPQEVMHVLVYDLGGGTFDATLIEMREGHLRTMATDGDVRLGGRDWDEIVARYCADKFKAAHGIDLEADEVAFQKLMTRVEDAKHTLTLRSSITLDVEHAGKIEKIEITREFFEEETAHLVERTAYVTRQLLTTAGLEWADLSRILLVGGSTRMPMIANMLLERTGIEPDRSVNPDEAVARGAAIYADYLLSKTDDQRETHFEITNVNSHSLGIEGLDPETNQRRNNIIIPKNSALPATRAERFVTSRPNQASVVVKVLEGESPNPEECTPIGRTVIRDLPPNIPAGWPIKVTYEYGTNGRLNVTAKVKGSDNVVNLELEREGALSNALVARWGKIVNSNGGLLALQELLNKSDESAGMNAPAPQQTPTPTPENRPHPTPANINQPPPSDNTGTALHGLGGRNPMSPQPVPPGAPKTPAAGQPADKKPFLQTPLGIILIGLFLAGVLGLGLLIGQLMK